MAKTRRNQKNQGNNLFTNAPMNPDRKKWRQNPPHPYQYDTGMPNNLFPSYPPNSMTFPFQNPGRGYPEMIDGYHNPQYFQPPLHPSPPAASGDAWAVNSNVRYQPMGEANANVNTNMMNAQADTLEDQEKRLFLEEYRYPGQHTRYEAPSCSPEPVQVQGTGTDMNTTSDKTKEIHDVVLTSKLRGDAPEFVPMKSNVTSLTIVTSW